MSTRPRAHGAPLLPAVFASTLPWDAKRLSRAGWIAAFTAAGCILGVAVAKGYSLHLLILLGAAGFVALCLLRPLDGLLAYLLAYPLVSTLSVSMGAGVPDITASRAAIPVICFGVLAQIYTGKRKPRATVGRTKVWMAAFCLTVAASTFLNSPAGTFVETMLHFVDIFLLPFLLYALALHLFSEERHLARCAVVAAIALAYLSVMGIYEHYTWNDLIPVEALPDASKYVTGLRIDEGTGILRTNGPFQYPETFGMVLGMLIILLSGYIGVRSPMPRPTRFVKALNLVVLPLGSLGLFFNMFRAVWLGVAAGLTVRFALFRRYWARMAGIGIALAMALLAGYSALKATSVYTTRIANAETLNTRIATWRIGLATYLDRPFMGAGFDRYTTVTAEKRNVPDTFMDSTAVPEAHSDYLAILVEEGLLGLAVYGLLFASLFQRAWNTWKEADGRAKPMVAVSFGLLFMHLLPGFFCKSGHVEAANIFFYALMGAITGATGRIRDSSTGTGWTVD